MLVYRLAGLTVSSEIPLPIAHDIHMHYSEHTADLVYRISEEKYSLFEDLKHGIEVNGMQMASRMRVFGEVILTTYQDEEAFYLVWNKLGLGFRISSDAQLVEVSGVTFENLGYLPWLLLSQVLGFVLHLKGLLCLHASVVQKESRAIGLLGTNGRGKSTLTAFLVRAGWSLISDDILCVEDNTLCLRPCFPFMKLSRNTIDFLRLHKAPKVPIPSTDKMKVDVDGVWGKFTDAALDLQAIYFVRRVDENQREISEVEIGDLSPYYARACLVSNGFAVGFLNAQQRRDYARRARSLAERIPIRRLNYPTGLIYLGAVEEALSVDILDQPMCEDRAR